MIVSKSRGHPCPIHREAPGQGLQTFCKPSYKNQNSLHANSASSILHRPYFFSEFPPQRMTDRCPHPGIDHGLVGFRIQGHNTTPNHLEPQTQNLQPEAPKSHLPRGARVWASYSNAMGTDPVWIWQTTTEL